jgi:hypothetical protein
MKTSRPLTLEYAEEPFGERVVGAAADRAHAADQIVAAQEALLLVARELTPSIRVQEHSFAIFALPQRHGYCLQDELTILNGAHPPTDREP